MGLVSVVATVALAAAPSLRPVAVAGLGGGRIAALNKTGEIALATGNDRTVLKQLSGITPVDMAGAGGAQGRYVILVSSLRRNLGSGDVMGALDAIPSGASLRTPGMIYSGVALMPGSSTAGFAADARRRDVFTLTLSDKAITAKQLTSVRDPEAILGSLAVDASGQRLYIADQAGGKIWSVATRGGEPALFATGLRDLRAIAADDRWVFAADGDGRRIVQFAQRPPPAAPRQSVASARSLSLAEFKAPSAVAISGPGEIAVGDPAAGAVWLITTSDGKVVRTIR
jgi:hypothetical protein